MLLTRTMAAVALLAIAGCCPFVGDSSAAPRIDAIFSLGSGTQIDVNDGGTVPILRPGQGGGVLFIGARYRNMGSCVSISAQLRDPATNAIAGFESRTVDSDVGPDGQSASVKGDNYDTANVPVCPANTELGAVSGRVWTLDVTVTDSSGKSAKSSIKVTPICGSACC